MTKRVQLLIHSFWPERTPPQRRWQHLVAAMRAEGWDVDVVTLSANPRATPGTDQPYGSYSRRPALGPSGEQVRRVPRIPMPNTRLGRFVSEGVSSLLMVPRALAAPKPDVVIATVPALPVICVGWLAARLQRRPLIIDMRDAWPELAREAGVKAGPVGRIMESVVTGIQRRADLVVAVTEGFARRLRERGVENVETVSNGVDLQAVPELDQRPRQAGELRIAYLGNHGESQALENVIEAVVEIHRESQQAAAEGQQGLDVVLRLVGSGTQKERLVEAAGGCPAVEFHDVAHGEEIWEHYRWADTALVSLRTDWTSFAWTVPSKTFELMGLGKHITAVVTGEAADILRRADNVSVLEDTGSSLKDLLTELAEDPASTPVSRSGRRWAAAHADLPDLGRRFAGIVDKLVSRTPTSKKTRRT